MVEWSGIISGSIPDGLFGKPVAFEDTPEEIHAFNMSQPQPQPLILLNPEYVKKIDEILSLVISSDRDGTFVQKVIEIKNGYIASGVLTKEDMETLNGIWKRVHLNKSTEPIVVKISNLLRGIND